MSGLLNCSKGGNCIYPAPSKEYTKCKRGLHCKHLMPVVSIKDQLAAEREKREKVEKELEQAREAFNKLNTAINSYCEADKQYMRRIDTGSLRLAQEQGIKMLALKGGENNKKEEA